MIALLVSLATLAAAQGPEPEIHGRFDGEPMYTVLPPDRIPAIRVPEFVTGEQADRLMAPDEPVLGVVVDGDARAYSLWHLDRHEIVNDTIAGRAVAATW